MFDWVRVFVCNDYVKRGESSRKLYKSSLLLLLNNSKLPLIIIGKTIVIIISI